MTTISAKVIADSISNQGIRITTLQLRYPRVIHSEFMTHRDFSRNASSSRAIPVERLIQDVLDDPYVPIHWGKNQKGMQAHEECNNPVMDWHYETPYSREEAWLDARDYAIKIAREFHKAGYHKQIVNRLLEPFSHINVVVTSTRWANFFALRDHEDAMPEIRQLAIKIKQAMANNHPEKLEFDHWHLPFVIKPDWLDVHGPWRDNIDLMIKVSVARCARVSYLTHEGKKPTIEDDLKLYDQLIGSVPLHASPSEHQACPDIWLPEYNRWNRPHLHGNFHGWIQYRKTLKGECVDD